MPKGARMLWTWVQILALLLCNCETPASSYPMLSLSFLIYGIEMVTPWECHENQMRVHLKEPCGGISSWLFLEMGKCGGQLTAKISQLLISVLSESGLVIPGRAWGFSKASLKSSALVGKNPTFWYLRLWLAHDSKHSHLLTPLHHSCIQEM